MKLVCPTSPNPDAPSHTIPRHGFYFTLSVNRG